MTHGLLRFAVFLVLSSLLPSSSIAQSKADISEADIEAGLKIPSCLKNEKLNSSKARLSELSEASVKNWTEAKRLSLAASELRAKKDKKKLKINDLPKQTKLEFLNHQKSTLKLIRRLAQEFESLNSEYEKLVKKNFGKKASQSMNEKYEQFESQEGYRLDCGSELLDIQVFLKFKLEQILDPEWQPELKFDPLPVPGFEPPPKKSVR